MSGLCAPFISSDPPLKEGIEARIALHGLCHDSQADLLRLPNTRFCRNLRISAASPSHSAQRPGWTPGATSCRPRLYSIRGCGCCSKHTTRSADCQYIKWQTGGFLYLRAASEEKRKRVLCRRTGTGQPEESAREHNIRSIHSVLSNKWEVKARSTMWLMNDD